MREKTNLGLVKHCEKALNEKWHYCWGTYGQKASNSQRDASINKWPAYNARFREFLNQAVYEKKRVADCYGLVKSYLLWQGDDIVTANRTDVLNTNTRVAYDSAIEKGPLFTLPEIQGVILWKSGHVGVYIGDGEYIEMYSGGYKCRKKKVKDSNFTHWFKDIRIEYVVEKPKLEKIETLEVAEAVEIPQIPIIQDASKLSLIIDGKERESKRVMIDNENYVRLRDICDLLGYYADYDVTERIPELTKK